jgi:hypothetical protein
MNTVLSPRSIRFLFLFALGLVCLGLFAAAGRAAEASAATPLLQANFLFELVADRARLIQVSLVFVVCGIALLWWRR